MNIDKKLYYFSDVKHLELDIPVPYKKMLKEAVALKDRYTEHRNCDNLHKGWKSVSLYGISEQHHDTWKEHGYSSAVEAAKHYRWTAAANKCPNIVNWLKTKFPCTRFGRVRLMLVEAGGHIGLHNDTKHKILENINIPLNNPIGCIWKWGNGEKLFMTPGNVYAMNISYDHSIYNNSLEDRFHLIVSRHDSTKEWQQLIDKAARKQGVTGEYQLHDIAV